MKLFTAHNKLLYKDNDPAYLIFNKKHKEKAITIMKYDDKKYRKMSRMDTLYPVQLEKIDKKNIDRQMVRFFFNSFDKTVRLRSVLNKKLYVISDSFKFLASFGSYKRDLGFVMKSIPHTSFVKILSTENKCLEAEERNGKSIVVFKKCNKKDEQKFSITMQNAILCKLFKEMCPLDELDYIQKEEEQRKFLSRVITDF